MIMAAEASTMVERGASLTAASRQLAARAAIGAIRHAASLGLFAEGGVAESS
jgi:hypothetical protein